MAIQKVTQVVWVCSDGTVFDSHDDAFDHEMANVRIFDIKKVHLHPDDVRNHHMIKAYKHTDIIRAVASICRAYQKDPYVNKYAKSRTVKIYGSNRSNKDLLLTITNFLEERNISNFEIKDVDNKHRSTIIKFPT